MKQYTITLKGKNKVPYFKVDVEAESKNEAWAIVREDILNTLKNINFNGEIEIKEGRAERKN